MSHDDQLVSGTHTWLVLMKAHRALQRHAERSIVEQALGLSDFGVLEILLHKGPQRVNDIGRTIGLTSGAISNAVSRLEGQGLIARADDPTDRRSCIVRLTPDGTARARDAFASHSAALERATRDLTADERATLVALLKKLGHGAQARFDEKD